MQVREGVEWLISELVRDVKPNVAVVDTCAYTRTEDIPILVQESVPNYWNMVVMACVLLCAVSIVPRILKSSSPVYQSTCLFVSSSVAPAGAYLSVPMHGFVTLVIVVLLPWYFVYKYTGQLMHETS